MTTSRDDYIIYRYQIHNRISEVKDQKLQNRLRVMYTNSLNTVDKAIGTAYSDGVRACSDIDALIEICTTPITEGE